MAQKTQRQTRKASLATPSTPQGVAEQQLRLALLPSNLYPEGQWAFLKPLSEPSTKKTITPNNQPPLTSWLFVPFAAIAPLFFAQAGRQKIAITPSATEDLTEILPLLSNDNLALWQKIINLLPAQIWQPVKPPFLAPLSPQSRIFCVGRNYADHAREMTQHLPAAQPSSAQSNGNAPDIFLRLPSSFAGHGQDIFYPKTEPSFDYEAELAFMIGREGHHISPEAAISHIAGITLANDGSIRRLQKRTSQFTLGKNSDASGCLGPCLYLGLDPLKPRTLRSYINGEQRQAGLTSDMIFSIRDLIVELSRYITLKPGDVILSGTPSGVGAGFTPPRYLKSGDHIHIESSAPESSATESSAIEGGATESSALGPLVMQVKSRS